TTAVPLAVSLLTSVPVPATAIALTASPAVAVSLTVTLPIGSLIGSPQEPALTLLAALPTVNLNSWPAAMPGPATLQIRRLPVGGGVTLLVKVTVVWLVTLPAGTFTVTVAFATSSETFRTSGLVTILEATKPERAVSVTVTRRSV